MSKHCIEHIACPQCSSKGEFIIWESVNVDLNPELRDKIFKDETFLWTCPRCGEQVYVPYDMLYHNMEKQFMLFYSPFEPETGKYEPLDLPSDLFLDDYTIRKVYGLKEFKEKIRILECGLNDIVIERMKFMETHILHPYMASNDIELLFHLSNGKDEEIAKEFGDITFLFKDVDNEVRLCGHSMNYYYELLEAVRIDSRMHAPSGICIDQEWIGNQLRSSGLYCKTGLQHGYSKDWDEGYRLVESGARKNLLREDGTEVLSEWFHSIFHIHGGFFTFGNTIPKKGDTPTRYVEGLAHVSGYILFPPLFENVRWTCENSWFQTEEEKANYVYNAVYGELDGNGLVLQLSGGIYNLDRSHLPQKAKLDQVALLEKVINWTLPGLQFFYRDTDAPIIVDTTYHIGDTIRAGFITDATTKLLKPAHKTRFLIASAHSAQLHAIDELTQNDPNAKKWNLCLFHPNSYFKVLDIYKAGGVTQVLLLHIPLSGAYFFGDDTIINFINDSNLEHFNLIQTARQSLDTKLTQEIHPRSLDPEWCKRMNHPIGVDSDYYPIHLAPVPEPEDPELAALSNLIHKLADDADIDFTDVIVPADNFPWDGIKCSVCEGCIYAKGIQGKGEGCGRLFKETFRKHYLRGHCEYRKEQIFELSEFERKERDKAIAAEKAAEPLKEPLSLLKSFIQDHLNGNIDNLKSFNFENIREDEKYGDCFGMAFSPNNCAVVRAIMSIAFYNTWPEFTYESMRKHTYSVTRINPVQELLGSPILREYFKGMAKFDPSKEQSDKAWEFYRRHNTIGNFIVLPGAIAACYDTQKGLRAYMDRFLSEFSVYFKDLKKTKRPLLDAINAKKKLTAPYFDKGFAQIVKDQILDEYVTPDYTPTQLFEYISINDKDLTRERYFGAIDKYFSITKDLIEHRAEKIIEKIKQYY